MFYARADVLGGWIFFPQFPHHVREQEIEPIVIITMTTDVPKTDPDQYGQVHPIESHDLIASKLKDLEKELSKSELQSPGYQGARTHCPEQLTNDFKLQFLRCEQFQVDLAAKRIMKYWDKRVEIFGQDLAYLPMTLKGALKDDRKALEAGFVRLLPGIKEPGGRSILYADPSRYAPKKERITTVRALWYVMHAALEDVETQQKGVVIIADPRKAKMSQTDTKLDKLNVESIRGCLPVRVAAMHLCHMPAFFALIFPIIKVFLGERLRQRIKLHNGSVSHVMERLSTFGLTSEMLPNQLGGNFLLDHERWLADRERGGM